MPEMRWRASLMAPIGMSAIALTANPSPALTELQRRKIVAAGWAVPRRGRRLVTFSQKHVRTGDRLPVRTINPLGQRLSGAAATERSEADGEPEVEHRVDADLV